MNALGYRPIDVDNHYYEPIDSFTRHLPKEFRSRGVQMVQDGKRTLAVFGGTVTLSTYAEVGMPARSCSISARICWLHGSAPKIPISIEYAAGSSPARSISSTIRPSAR